ncbi:MAG: GspE/PulE family protein [Planctomycetota bacterium]
MPNAIQSSTPSKTHEPLIVRLLRDLDRVSPDRIEELWHAPIEGDATVEDLVMRSGIADERDIAAAYASHYLMPLFDPPADQPPPVDPAICEVLPSRLCRDHLIVPLADDGSTLEVALFSPDSLLLADEIKSLTGRQMRPMFAPLTVIERLISLLYAEGSWNGTVASSSMAKFEEVNEIEDAEDQECQESGEVVHLDQSPPPGRDGRIIRYINSIFEQALKNGASDIHVEPYEDACRVRMRVDGMLLEIAPPPMTLLSSVISRLKALAKMDLAERRLPQDGDIVLRHGDHRVDMRINTCPTVVGEKVVMRVLDKRALPHDLTSLGLDDRQFLDLSEAIRSPHGLMLVTGPTGSGKSTTLYSCLSELNDSGTNICTIEDPVEFKFGGINQVQTRAKAGLDCANAMRALLRQDPDVLMIGEVRDGETAQLCVRAALTGHSVFSSLPTNDALSSITRLKDMGVEPFLLASTVRLLIAQRLLRRLCPSCKVPTPLEDQAAARLGLQVGQVVYGPRGCDECRDLGYRGRLAIFEVIHVTQRISEMIRCDASVEDMETAARADGMKLLRNAAMDKVVTGETSLEEALSLG